MRTFIFQDDKSNKFWSVEHKESDLHLNWGKINTQGQSQIKSFPDRASAQAAMEKLIKEKIRKGYVEQSADSLASDEPDSAPVATVKAPPQAQAPKAIISAEIPPDVPPWLAADPICLSPALLKKIAIPRCRPGDEIQLQGMACWQSLRDLLINNRCYQPDLEETDSECVEAWKEAWQRLVDDRPQGCFDSDMALLMLVVYYMRKPFRQDKRGGWHRDDMQQVHFINHFFADFIVETRGLPYWMDMLHASLTAIDEYSLPRIALKYNGESCLDNYLFCEFDKIQLRLREHLSAASIELWQQCLSKTIANDVITDKRVSNVFIPFGFPDAERHAMAALVNDRGLHALPLLLPNAAEPVINTVLTYIGLPQTILALAQVADRGKSLQENFVTACRRWPQSAIAVLAEQLVDKSDAMLTATLEHLLLAYPDDIAKVTSWLSPGAVKLIGKSAGDGDDAKPLADESELPEVLISPPWLSTAKGYKRKPLTLEILPFEAREYWPQGERESLKILDYDTNMTDITSRLGFCKFDQQCHFMATKAFYHKDVNGLVTALKNSYYNDRFFYYPLIELPLPWALELGTAFVGMKHQGMGYVLAHLGLPFLPVLEASLKANPARDIEYALNFASVELAQTMAQVWHKRKPLREKAQQWLLRFPECVIITLLPVALGKSGDPQNIASRVLRLLDQHGHRSLIIDVAKRYELPEILDEVEHVLNLQPIMAFPSKIAKAPDFWLPKSWYRPCLKENLKGLPDSALEHLGTMLRFPLTHEVYPGIEQVKQACTPESLANFVWDCFQAWLNFSAPSKDSWVMTALGLLGNDNTARMLEPYIRAWPGESQSKRATAGLDVLALIGSDMALSLLSNIAEKVKFAGLREQAKDRINQIAEERGLTLDQLGDRVVPDLGLDSQGMLLLDFGPRQFRVGFNDALKPYVKDEQGSRLATLPRVKKSDDAPLAEIAVARFNALKKEVKIVAKHQLERLNLAMRQRRRWGENDFRQYLVDHPLMRFLTQRLIWKASMADGSLVGFFRVAEDGSFTNADDDLFLLPSDNRDISIEIAHIVGMSDEELDGFRQIFTDYEIISPFEQLNRGRYFLTNAELQSAELTRWQGMPIVSGKLYGLMHKGWVLDSYDNLVKEMDNGCQILLTLSSGFYPGMNDDDENYEVKTVAIHGDKPPVTFSLLDKISVSELIRDIESLKA